MKNQILQKTVIFCSIVFLSFSALDSSAFQKQEEVYKKRREDMARKQIEGRGVRDKAVIDAMRTVERHKFVPDNMVESAYNDSALPIGYGQTISQPYMVAYMTEIIKPKPGHKILEIGTGSGYQAAVLAEIIDSVFTIEIIPELWKSAGERLKKLGYDNVKRMNEDGYYGWEEHAPFDAVVVTAAAEFIPPPLIKQLKEGGKMIIPVGSPFLVQTLTLVEKNNGKIRTRSLMPVRFVPFTRKK